MVFDPCADAHRLPIQSRTFGIAHVRLPAIFHRKSERGPMMAGFRLAHLSDPHLPPLPVARLRDLAGKRAFGYLNWTRNRHKYHRREVLDALVADMQAQRPDHVAVTGDLVNLALDAEFTPAQA